MTLRRPRLGALACAAAAVAWVACPAAEATTTRPLSLDQLIGQATHVLQGDVLARTAAWKGGMLTTTVTLRVSECLKGACADEKIEVETFGGQLGGLTMKVDGESTFEVGERVVVFLHPLAGKLHTVGMAQGKLVPVLGARDDLLTRDEAGMALAGAVGDGPPGAPVGGSPADAGGAAGSPAGGDRLAGLTLKKLRARIFEIKDLVVGADGALEAPADDGAAVDGGNLGREPPPVLPPTDARPPGAVE